MPISGPVVHQQLMDAYANLQSRLVSARGPSSDASQERHALDDERSEALVALAEHYLPELTRDAIRTTWHEVRPSVSKLLLRKEDHTRRLSQSFNDVTARRENDEQQLIRINGRLDEALDAQKELSDQVEQILREDDEFVQLADRAAVAEAALERAEANLEEIEQGSEKKLPAYDNSALFNYLQQRHFGTPQYTKRGLTRRVDRWLAKLIDYRKAKQGYDFLRKTPEQMRQIIKEDREALDTVMDELERRRDDVANEVGLPEQIKTAQQITDQREHVLGSLAEVLSTIETTQHELTELEDPRGPYYREAIQLFRDMLASSDSRDLDRRAQQTDDITDDQIVGRLLGVEADMEQLVERTRRRNAELDRAQQFLDDFGRLIQRFRAARFDSSRSQFVGSLDVLGEIDRANESGDAELVWSRIRDAQRWGPTAMEKVSAVASHPLTHVLVSAMAHAAGGAMGSYARRAGSRRGNNRSRGRRLDWDWDTSWGGDSSGWRRRR